jgi:cobalt-zinc-cadmium efflux system membrane fusion protein
MDRWSKEPTLIFPRRAQLSFVVAGVLVFVMVTLGIIFVALPGVRATVTELFERPSHEPVEKAEDDGAALIRDAEGHLGLKLTPDAARGLDVTPVAVVKADKPRALPPQIGTLNYDNDRLFTIRSRFPGEVAEMRKVLDTDPSTSRTQLRPLRFGDKLDQGELLAVVWSQPLGQAKAALVDAICGLALSKKTLDRQLKLYQDGVIPVTTLEVSERQVQADSNALVTAERSLKMWKLTDQEIQAIKDEAKVIADLVSKNQLRSAEKEKNWARVEIRVPKFSEDPRAQLVVIEKNTNLIDMVDPINSVPLFKLADTSRLQIWVHPPEEYLPLIRERLKDPGAQPLTWEIRIQSDPPDAPALVLPIVQVAPSLEPNQHTPMVLGYLDNPEGKYLIGQFVTATIYMPPDRDTVEMPTNALNEVEGQALVFVQPDASKEEFFLRRLAVVRRFKDVTFVRSKLTPPEEEISRAEVARGRRALQPLRPGERVLTRGAVELTTCLEDLATKERAAGLAKDNK